MHSNNSVVRSASYRGVAAGTTAATQQANIRLKKAGLFDLPFIFNQIMKGAVDGVYTEKFLSRRGHLQLFKGLFLDLLPLGELLGKRKIYDFQMFCRDGDEIGFAGLRTDAKGAYVIGFFGIDQRLRRRRNGALMLRELVAYLPAGARVEAHTTRFAVGMQRLLGHAGFRQSNDDPTSKLSLYVLDKGKARQKVRREY